MDAVLLFPVPDVGLPRIGGVGGGFQDIEIPDPDVVLRPGVLLLEPEEEPVGFALRLDHVAHVVAREGIVVIRVVLGRDVPVPPDQLASVIGEETLEAVLEARRRPRLGRECLADRLFLAGLHGLDQRVHKLVAGLVVAVGEAAPREERAARKEEAERQQRGQSQGFSHRASPLPRIVYQIPYLALEERNDDNSIYYFNSLTPIKSPIFALSSADGLTTGEAMWHWPSLVKKAIPLLPSRTHIKPQFDTSEVGNEMVLPPL